MKAFKNTPITKEKLLEHLESHQRADAFTKGQYSISSQEGCQQYPPSHFRGCAIGCAINSVNLELGNNGLISNSDHKTLGMMLNIPFKILRLVDHLFEAMNITEGKNLMIDFIKNVKVGSDLSVIKWNIYKRDDEYRFIACTDITDIFETTSVYDARDHLFKLLKEL